MNPIVSGKLQEIAAICEKHFVVGIAVFGSVLTPEFNEESDIDLVVTFGDVPLLGYADNFFDLEEKLESLFGRKVHLVTSSSLTNPYFIAEIERTKQVLYAA